MILTATLFALASFSPAQIEEDFRLVSPDPGFFHQFGRSVSLSGDTVAIASPNDDAFGYRSGAVYIFERDDAHWLEQARLKGIGIGSYDYFGRSVELYNDTLAVSSSATSEVHIFERSSGNWTQLQRISNSDVNDPVYFGQSLAINHNTLVIGAPQQDWPGTAGGAVLVYAHNGNRWVKQAVITASDGVRGTNFGWDVALDGNTLLVGAPTDIGTGLGSGAAYVFTRQGSTWTEQAKLTSLDGDSEDKFGFSVAISQGRALIGAYQAGLATSGSDAGAGYLFESNSGTWTQTAKVVPQGLKADHQFGYSVALDGDLAVLSSRGYFNRRGGFTFFHYADGAWSQLDHGLDSLGQSNHDFGYALDLDGGRMVVGAPRFDHQVDDIGAAGIYSLFRLGINPEQPIGGQISTIHASGGFGNSWTHMAMSVTGYGAYALPSHGITLSLDTPYRLSQPKQSDATGNATWEFTVPTEFIGMRFWIQGFQEDRITNVRSIVVQ